MVSVMIVRRRSGRRGGLHGNHMTTTLFLSRGGSGNQFLQVEAKKDEEKDVNGGGNHYFQWEASGRCGNVIERGEETRIGEKSTVE